MKFAILSENSNGTWPYLHYRSIGAYELQKRIIQHGHTSTVLDWFTHWTHDQLKQALTICFAGETEPVIAISTPFDVTDVYKIHDVLIWAREQWPTLKIIHGGARTFDPSSILGVDIFFLGRSMKIFDAWIKGDNIQQYAIRQDPLVLSNNAFDQNVDVPVLPVLSSNDYLSKYDIMGFEIGVGCKFNCTFCNYELRAAKVTRLTDSYSLRAFFEEAYGRYGIKNFYAADDTPNETDEKLAVLADAVDGLSFKPNITGFSRLDIVTGRPSQLELYRRIQFASIFFGVESFNDAASRLVRKKSSLGSTQQTLKNLREVSPNTFMVGGLIVGLNGDSEQSIRDNLERVINEDLLDSVQLYPLSIARSKHITSEGYHSQLDLNPEKFGYQIKGTRGLHVKNDAVDVLNWTSDWTNLEKSAYLAQQLQYEYKDRITFVNHMEYAGLLALGLARKDLYKVSKETIINLAQQRSDTLKARYVEAKMNWLLTTADSSATI